MLASTVTLLLGATIALAAPSTAAASQAITYLAGQNHRGILIGDASDGEVYGVGQNNLYTPDWTEELIQHFADVINTNASPHQFIQAGTFMGNLTQENCAEIQPDAFWYWEDKRPNSPLYCHLGPAAPFGGYRVLTIFQTSPGGSTWDVGIGSFAEQSTNSLTSENLEEAGTWATLDGNSIQACDYDRNLDWFDGYGALHYGWRDALSGAAKIAQNEPPYGYFVDSPSSLDYPSWYRSYSPASMSNCF